MSTTPTGAATLGADLDTGSQGRGQCAIKIEFSDTSSKAPDGVMASADGSVSCPGRGPRRTPAPVAVPTAVVTVPVERTTRRTVLF